MTAQPAPASPDPQRLLAASRELTRRVRREQRGAWFALLVFAVVTFAAIPFDRYGHRHLAHCASINGGRGYVCTSYSALTAWYWPVALLLAYLVITWFYLDRARRRGVGSPVWPYVAAGVVLVVLITAWALWAQAHPGFLAQSLHIGPGSHPIDFLYRIVSPAGAIGLALLVLARIERSWALLAITAGYLIVVIASFDLGPVHHPSQWAFLPHLLLDGAVLLLGGVVLALIQQDQSPAST
jgi:hypothetical protein